MRWLQVPATSGRPAAAAAPGGAESMDDGHGNPYAADAAHSFPFLAYRWEAAEQEVVERRVAELAQACRLTLALTPTLTLSPTLTLAPAVALALSLALALALTLALTLTLTLTLALALTLALTQPGVPARG